LLRRRPARHDSRAATAHAATARVTTAHAAATALTLLVRRRRFGISSGHGRQRPDCACRWWRRLQSLCLAACPADSWLEQPGHLDEVALRRVGHATPVAVDECVRERAVVREEQQTLCVAVEPADVRDSRKATVQTVVDGEARRASRTRQAIGALRVAT